MKNSLPGLVVLGRLLWIAVFLVAARAAATEEQRVVEKIGATPPPSLDAALPTLWIAGDSTAANGTPDATGWGKPIAWYFNETKLNVANRARGGRSSKTFHTEGLWDQLLAQVKAGDFVLIQFGHNDGGDPFTGKARASLPGLGEQTRDGVLPDGKAATVHTFGWYMRKMIADVQAKNATPIVLSLTIRNRWKDGRVERGNGPYGEWSRQLAAAQGTAFIDLAALVSGEYQRLGEETVKGLFPKDYVHTGPAGADLNASFVVAGLKALRGNPLAPYFSAKGEAVAAAATEFVMDAPDHELGPGERAVRLLARPANPELPSIFLIGDSTVRNGSADGAGGQWGWGEPLAALVDARKFNVVNRAIGGLSSRTYFTQGHWERTLSLLRTGDVVVMQFGHNDSSPVNDDKRARGTLKGTGEETESIDNLLTKRPEVVHSYGWYLRKFVRDAKEKGAVPVVCSPIPRKKWENGKVVRSGVDGYAAWARQVAAEEGVGFIDLNAQIADRYDALGAAAVEPMFADEHTHTSRAGAELNAGLVLDGLRVLQLPALAELAGPVPAEEATPVAAH